MYDAVSQQLFLHFSLKLFPIKILCEMPAFKKAQNIRNRVYLCPSDNSMWLKYAIDISTSIEMRLKATD
jgi:hypothetical protein